MALNPPELFTGAKLINYGRNDAKAEAPVLWPPDVKSRLTRKDSYTGQD